MKRIMALVSLALIHVSHSSSYAAPPVIVAVIDTGADIKHKDLKAHLWTNPGETGLDTKGRSKESNGIDDDGNGFIDDVHGWNFINNTNKIGDQNGHGTHIAGIIVDKKENFHSAGIQLMILKYYDNAANAQNALPNTIKAIEYANRMQVDIINYSGGGLTPSPLEMQAIHASREKNILFVAAAGNERSNSDFKKFFPANYGLRNILSVTAHDAKNKILPSSNYGKKTVDIAALGKDVRSAVPQNRHEDMTGTSQATAKVTAAAASLIYKMPAFRRQPTLLIQHLQETSTHDENLLDKTKSSSRLSATHSLNAYRKTQTVSGHRVEAGTWDNLLDWHNRGTKVWQE